MTVGMAALACAVFPMPLTISLLLGLMGGQTDLLPVIVIGAVIGFIVIESDHAPTSETSFTVVW